MRSSINGNIDSYLEIIPTMNLSLSQYQYELTLKNKSIDSAQNVEITNTNAHGWKGNLHVRQHGIDFEIIKECSFDMSGTYKYMCKCKQEKSNLMIVFNPGINILHEEKHAIEEIQSLGNFEIPRSYISCKAGYARKFKNIEKRAKLKIQRSKVEIVNRENLEIQNQSEKKENNNQDQDIIIQPAAKITDNENSRALDKDRNRDRDIILNESEEFTNLQIGNKLINKKNMLLKYISNSDNFPDYFKYQPLNKKSDVGLQISEIESLYHRIKADLIELNPLLRENPKMKEQLLTNISQGNEEKLLFFTNLYKLINSEKIHGNCGDHSRNYSFTNCVSKNNKALDNNSFCSQQNGNISFHNNFKQYLDMSPSMKKYIQIGNKFLTPSCHKEADLKNASLFYNPKVHRNCLNSSYINTSCDSKKKSQTNGAVLQRKMNISEENPYKVVDARYNPGVKKINFPNFK